MTRINVLLLVALVFSAMYLVRVAHDSRRLYADLDKAREEQRVLDVEYERLKSDKQIQATPLRVEQAAREKLQMRVAGPAVTQYIRAVAAGASAAQGASQ